MKNPASIHIIRSSLLLALLLPVCFTLQAEPATATSSPKAEPEKPDHCQMVEQQKQQLRDDMKAQDAALTEQLAQMNSAPDDKKLALMAAVVTRMVEQRIAMDGRRAKIDEMIRQHMPIGMGGMSHHSMPGTVAK
jgi:hypothetical protein